MARSEPQRRGSAMRWMRYVGLALLVVLIYMAGPRRLIGIARTANPWWLLFAWALNIPQLSLKAFRWYMLLRWQKIALPFKRAVLAYFASLLVGFLTPGRLGELAKAITVRYEASVPMARALSSVVIDRVFDMYLLLALGSLGVVRFALVGTRLSWGTFAACCILLALPLLFLNARIARRAGAQAALMLPPGKKREAILEKIDQFADGLAVWTPLRALFCGAVTIVSYTIFFIQCFCCMRALGFGVSTRDLVLMQAASNFLSFIPISVAGLGTREASLVYFFSKLPQPLDSTLAVAYGLALFLVLFLGGGLLGFIAWQWAPIGLHHAWRDLRGGLRATSASAETEVRRDA